MIFTVKGINFPAGALGYSAGWCKYTDGYRCAALQPEDLANPFGPLVPAKTLEPTGFLDVYPHTGEDVMDEYRITTSVFTAKDGATYICDFATKKVYEEGVAPPGPKAKFKLWWLIVPAGLVGIILVARRRR